MIDNFVIEVFCARPSITGPKLELSVDDSIVNSVHLQSFSPSMAASVILQSWTLDNLILAAFKCFKPDNIVPVVKRQFSMCTSVIDWFFRNCVSSISRGSDGVLKIFSCRMDLLAANPLPSCSTSYKERREISTSWSPELVLRPWHIYCNPSFSTRQSNAKCHNFVWHCSNSPMYLQVSADKAGDCSQRRLKVKSCTLSHSSNLSKIIFDRDFSSRCTWWIKRKSTRARLLWGDPIWRKKVGKT